MIELDFDDYEISEYRVLKSAAGFYIGKECIYKNGSTAPYSRDSYYYKTKEEASKALEIGLFARL